MKKLHQVSQNQNEELFPEHNNIAPEDKKRKTRPTSQRKVSSKREIKFTAEERKWVAYLIVQYGHEVPGWLRCKLSINQRRRKQLNDEFYEATVDGDYCHKCKDTTDWSYHMHRAWHTVNGIKPCF